MNVLSAVLKGIILPASTIGKVQYAGLVYPPASMKALNCLFVISYLSIRNSGTSLGPDFSSPTISMSVVDVGIRTMFPGSLPSGSIFRCCTIGRIPN